MTCTMPSKIPPDGHDPLEQLIDDALRGLPARTAPRSLESRVLAEIERRAAQSWWQSGFAHWPAAARACFFLLSVVVVTCVVQASSWLIGGLESATALSELTSAVTPAATSMQAAFAALASVFRSIPPLWIYGGLATLAVLYATLFGIGAAAYRTLYASR